MAKNVAKNMDTEEDKALMEAMKISTGSSDYLGLSDLAMELARKSEGFKRSMPSGTCRALSDLVRSMNCYYSNLIEGHDTHPIDIEKALNNDYSDDAKKRDLQKEARAHIEVQRWIDDGGLAGRAVAAEGLRDVPCNATRCSRYRRCLVSGKGALQFFARVQGQTARLRFAQAR